MVQLKPALPGVNGAQPIVLSDIDAAILTQIFGDGVDGNHTTIGAETLTFAKFYDNLTVEHELQVGVDGNAQFPAIFVRNKLHIKSGGILRPGYGPRQFGASGSASLDGTADKTTAGKGNDAYSLNLTSGHAGSGGGGGAGGGDGTNVGGHGRRALIGTYTDPDRDYHGVGNATGTTGAGVNGTAGGALITNKWTLATLRPRTGWPGWEGGSGALFLGGARVLSLGGGGGKGGRPGGILYVFANAIEIDAGGIIHARGEDGGDGTDGIAVDTAGDIAGGGGGGAGAGGGTLGLFHGPGLYVNNGTVDVAGGNGGTGGLGEQFDGGARASSDGGNGADGGTGIVVAERISF